MEIKRNDDMVKLVNIDKDKNPVIYTYSGNSKTVKDFIVIEREEAIHAVKKSYLPEPNTFLLSIEELPEGQRTKTVLSKAAEEVDVLKGQLSELAKRNEELEQINKELLEETARLRANIANLKQRLK